jgi:DNA-directed RNA polymerase subunit M/transcription elongation factor TFIIS
MDLYKHFSNELSKETREEEIEELIEEMTKEAMNPDDDTYHSAYKSFLLRKFKSLENYGFVTKDLLIEEKQIIENDADTRTGDDIIEDVYESEEQVVPVRNKDERSIIRDLFHSVCEKNILWSKLPKKEKNNMVRYMERECLRVAIEDCKHDGIDRFFTNQKFVNRYQCIVSKIICNLDNDIIEVSNLLEQLILRKINVHDIANLTSAELCPAANKETREYLNKRLNEKLEYKVSKAYKCPCCKNNKTIPTEYNPRASDESSVFSIRCITCEYVFRSSN